MYKFLWEVFKKTGSIEAYLYLYNYRILNQDEFEKRETLNKNGDCKYPRDSSQGSSINRKCFDTNHIHAKIR